MSMHSILMNTGMGFELVKLPQFAQISAVFGIVYDDFDHDGLEHIVIAGNLYNTELETSRNDAGKGLFLKGDGKGQFKAMRGYDSGLFIPGNVKKLKAIRLGKGESAKKGVIDDIWYSPHWQFTTSWRNSFEDVCTGYPP